MLPTAASAKKTRHQQYRVVNKKKKVHIWITEKARGSDAVNMNDTANSRAENLHNNDDTMNYQATYP